MDEYSNLLKFSEDGKTLIKCDKSIEGELRIPYGVVQIGNFAFEGCCKMKQVEIPNSIKRIGCFAFFCCCSLERIEIPNSVITIESGAFVRTGNADIIVGRKNTRYYDEDGCLYTKDKKSLLRVPDKYEAFTIPSSVQIIEMAVLLKM